jgi:8-oxo-dGTP pyrophosphatase MutT (NUDIX family)
LKQALSLRGKRPVLATGQVAAAILLPIFCKREQFYILFIKRTATVKSHKSQICFPGGAYQEEDSTVLNTALRECREEIGLKVNTIEVLGELDSVITKSSGYLIYPFVSFIPWPHKLRVNKRETEEVFEVPITALLDKDCFREETRIIEGKTITSYFYYFQGKVIWGATAGILNQFLGIFTQVMQS